jgi:hypothetical protein
VHRDDLKAARRVLKIANEGGTWCEVWRSMLLECRRVTEGIAAIVERYEPVSLGRIEPLDLALDGCLRKWTPRTAVFKVRHEFVDAMPARNELKSARENTSGQRPARLVIMRKRRANAQRGAGFSECSVVGSDTDNSARNGGFFRHEPGYKEFP